MPDEYCAECDLFDDVFFSHCNDCHAEVKKAFNESRCGMQLLSYVINMRDKRPRLTTPTPHTVIPIPVDEITYHPSEVIPAEKTMLSEGFALL